MEACEQEKRSVSYTTHLESQKFSVLQWKAPSVPSDSQMFIWVKVIKIGRNPQALMITSNDFLRPLHECSLILHKMTLSHYYQLLAGIWKEISAYISVQLRTLSNQHRHPTHTGLREKNKPEVLRIKGLVRSYHWKVPDILDAGSAQAKWSIDVSQTEALSISSSAFLSVVFTVIPFSQCGGKDATRNSQITF